MNLLHALETTRDETLAHFDLPDDARSRTYAPGKWSVRFVLHHLADSETVLHERIRRILSEQPRPVLWGFDQDAWAGALDYASMPLALSRQTYAAGRAGILYLAARHYEAQGDLTWVHSEAGLRTLREEFEKVATHNRHHLEQIRRALAGA